jgi:hypothetical protein
MPRKFDTKPPFAASNLQPALATVRTNFGLIIIAFLWLAVTFDWTLLG